ncbi:AMP-dependent synthetase/ligase [Mycobacteroides abscessus]|uniref:AMP-dependent synthetase/ligase n=1 Tax=Mycobacteroides abscessus TaxID=36809 RepID=UPI003AF684D6
MATFASMSSTMVEAFQATITRQPEAVAFRTVGGAVEVTFSQWNDQVRKMAAGLDGIGVSRGSKVALMLVNRPEFYTIDVAAQHLGAAPFSLYNTSSSEQIHYYLVDSGATVVLAEAQFVDKVLSTIDGTAVEHVVCIDAQRLGTLTVDLLYRHAKPNFDFEATWRSVRPDDDLTLIYTSGTTGEPKGVRVTHANMIAMVNSAERLWLSTAHDRLLSFLPSAHIADRLSALYHLQVVGNQLTTVSNRKDLPAALVDVRPTIFGAVPQVWQKLKTAVEIQLSGASGREARLSGWAVSVGRLVSDRELDRVAVSKRLRIQHLLADRLVLSRIRRAIGLDDLKLAISAAAPLPEEVLRFFNGIGIPLSDAWGMSEVAGVVTMSAKGHVRPGTVGTPLDGVEIRIALDGEILVRGPSVMKGYMNKPEASREAVDCDGWLHTGDIGELNQQGYLTLLDRKKELIINAGGKNMSPTVIENWIKTFSTLIAHAVTIGNNRNYNVALIALDPDAVSALARKRQLATDPAKAAQDPTLLDIVNAAIQQANTKLSRIEQIKKFRIVPEYWEPGSELLTATHKVRRRPIETRYAEIINELYK